MNTQKFPVIRTRCSECLFSEGRIVSVGTMQDILTECQETGNYFICHKDPQAQACCHGYYKAQLTQNVQVIARMEERGFELVEWHDIFDAATTDANTNPAAEVKQ